MRSRRSRSTETTRHSVTATAEDTRGPSVKKRCIAHQVSGAVGGKYPLPAGCGADIAACLTGEQIIEHIRFRALKVDELPWRHRSAASGPQPVGPNDHAIFFTSFS